MSVSSNINLMYLNYLASDVYGDSFELYDFVPQEIAVQIIEDLHQKSANFELFDWDFKEVIRETIAPKYQGKQLRGDTNPAYLVWQYVRGSVEPQDTLLWAYFHGQDISDIVTQNVQSGYHWLSETFIEPATDSVIKPISKALWWIVLPIGAYYTFKIVSNLTNKKRIV